MTTTTKILFENKEITIIDEQFHHMQLGWFGGVNLYKKDVNGSYRPLLVFPHNEDDYAVDGWADEIPAEAARVLSDIYPKVATLPN